MGTGGLATVCVDHSDHTISRSLRSLGIMIGAPNWQTTNLKGPPPSLLLPEERNKLPNRVPAGSFFGEQSSRLFGGFVGVGVGGVFIFGVFYSMRYFLVLSRTLCWVTNGGVQPILTLFGSFAADLGDSRKACGCWS